ncbi:uncharacterized protein KQ657_000182 [Scheffersomyces spartinae]|uniref:Uncharacterized protein n=1 Tax=Scheffersomyces spartinae TaxID=45513 RepID=A0A9P8AK69_9ASCO|nr:uncharacterized protein KQ657_000182 [Scheffersomyces spartinae]KAG7196170.1 hypothetical protein KQ657_000182 [Scheffersomyces spartinae]
MSISSVSNAAPSGIAPTIAIDNDSAREVKDAAGDNAIADENGYLEKHQHDHEDIDVLDMLRKRQSDSYRDLVLQIPARFNPVRKNYRKRVSFDTVNLEYDNDADLENPTESRLLEELAQEEAKRRSRFDNLNGYMFELERGRDRSLSPNRAASSYGNSPNATSPLRLLSPTLSPTRGMVVRSPRGSVFGRNSLYPTTPIITQPSCILTKTHKDFDALYKGKLPGMKPALPGRVIMVYISGRKHTWVALDWVLRNFVENGDTVVIVGVLGSVLQNLIRNRGLLPGKIIAQTPKMRYKLRSHPQYTKIITRNILNYAFQILNPHAIVRVMADMTAGKTKEVLKAMYLLYTPNIVVTGGKISTTVGAPLRSWTSSKLTDRLVKNFPLPVIVVPALTMGYFEENLKKELESRDFNEQDEEKAQIPRKKSVKKLITDSQGNLLPCIRPESSSVNDCNEKDDNDQNSYSSSSSSDDEEANGSIDDNSSLYDGRLLPRLDEDALSKHLQAKVSQCAHSINGDDSRSGKSITSRSKRSSFSSRSKRSSMSSRSRKGENSSAFSQSESESESEPESDDSGYSDRSSIASSGSYDSFKVISDLYLDYKDDINEVLHKTEQKPLTADTLITQIKAISDMSAQLCREFKEVNPSFSGKGSKLAREITGSNKFGEVPFKTKSLLEPVQPKPKLVNSTTTPAYSFKELQRKMKQQQQFDQLQVSPPPEPSTSLTKKMSPPQITISEVSPVRSPSPKTAAPKAGSLKFADSVSSTRPRKSIYSTTSKLTKALSHEIDTDNRFTLEPSKSHPDLTVVHNQSVSPDKEKKKKKRLLKFWK